MPDGNWWGRDGADPRYTAGPPCDRYDNDDDDDEDDDVMEAGCEKSAADATADNDDKEEMGENEAKAGQNGSTMMEGVDDDNSGEEGEHAYKTPARSGMYKTERNPFAQWQTDL